MKEYRVATYEGVSPRLTVIHSSILSLFHLNLDAVFCILDRVFFDGVGSVFRDDRLAVALAMGSDRQGF
ncbi:MAG TPA: hypothetical protein IGS17_14155 [Oscillatoriales cyanobacterium M59_W2019_021]|nr:hypothetical protein [Oscillatoriales cyanobacterium M59_W2019_021]